MGREVRRVPANWQHPQKEDGKYVPLYKGGGFESAEAEWNEGYAKWQEGLCEQYGDEKWEPIPAEHRRMRYSDYSRSRPSPDDYMPDWPAEVATHYMMYKNTSEGTPMSPAFATPEELARWLVDNNASAFADQTASYESWLRVAKGGWAPSAVCDQNGVRSGVIGLTSSTVK